MGVKSQGDQLTGELPPRFSVQPRDKHEVTGTCLLVAQVPAVTLADASEGLYRLGPQIPIKLLRGSLQEAPVVFQGSFLILPLID